MKPITLESWPQAICHLDADAFFATVEQSIHPELRGLPVITGAERGIVAAASYEAKALGIQRGVPLSEVKKIAPHCVLMPSDYETYSLYSKRMFSIIRRYTPLIEEYSIDEAFFDITGLRRLHQCSYKGIAEKIQKDVTRELDISVSLGISLSKTLCKIASKLKKPHGLVAIPGREIHNYLCSTPIQSVWGFGKNITALLAKKNIFNAYQYVQTPKDLIQKWLGKIGVEKWQELRGEPIYPLELKEKTKYVSIMKSKTFTPTRNREIVFSQAIRNLESACIKARRYGLGAKTIILYLRQQNFESHGSEIKLSRHENSPLLLNKFIKLGFEELFQNNITYRATGVVLGKLSQTSSYQMSLFENPICILSKRKVFEAVDLINKRFGKHTVFLGPGLNLKPQFKGERARVPQRKNIIFKGETKRQRLGLPLLQYKGI